MNTLHITTDTAVHATHTHSALSTGTRAVHATEKSGAASGRGAHAARDARQYPVNIRHRPPYMAAVEAAPRAQARGSGPADRAAAGDARGHLRR